MHTYLTLLRSGGVRLTDAQLAGPPRLVSLTMVQEAGYRCAIARCCYGGSEIGRLWSPSVVQIGHATMVVQGYEAYADAGVVQEWRLTPHCAGSRQGEQHEADRSTSSAIDRLSLPVRATR